MTDERSNDRALTEALLESLGDAVLAVDTSRTFLVVNGAARRVFSESAAPGKPLADNWNALHRSHGTDGSPLPLEEGALARGLRGEETNDLTFTLQRSDAVAPVWVEARGRPVRDAEGNVIAAVAVYRELDAERALAASLRRAEQVYRAIVQHMPNGGVFMVDRELRYVSAEGPAVAEILRRSKLDAIAGRLLTDVTTPENREKMRGIYESVFTGESHRFDIERDGRFFDAHAVPVYEGRDVSHALLFLHDITDMQREASELRRARDLIAEEHALFDETVANIEDGLVVLDLEGHTLVVNDAFVSMFNASRERMMA